MYYIQPLIGAAVILGIGYAFSTNRRAVNWTTIGWGLGLQIVFAFIVLKTSIGQRVFEFVGGYITKLLGFSNVGAAFVFGPLGDASVWGRAMTGRSGRRGRSTRSSSRSRSCRRSSSSPRSSPSSTTSASCRSSSACSRW
ncbi:MAG: Na+ dependent nucleoside transporter N-terminal domain-containing protein [Vicinamibacterales bacterium]